MTEKFQHKYRIASTRLAGYDYGQNGAYFITIYTYNRLHFFGKVIDNEMRLNTPGQFAEKYWQDIPDRFPFMELGEFVVMPNHIHGILVIHTPSPDDKTNSRFPTTLTAPKSN